MRSIKAILGDRETIVVARSASVADAARLMSAHHIGALPVLDTNDSSASSPSVTC